MDDSLLNLLYELDKEIEKQKEDCENLTHLDLVIAKSRIEGLEISKRLLLRKIDDNN